AEGVWRMLTAAGATPAGQDAYEVLRVEAGTPVYGVDIDENRFVMEVGRAERRSEEHTSELQSRFDLVCRLLLEKKKKKESTRRPTFRTIRLSFQVYMI